ncbi:MAG TPA: hypothetical protein VIH87_09530 [Methylocella sp.]
MPVWRETNGAARVLALADEGRALALVATAFDRPVEPHILAKMRRAAELWNDGDKALAHIHLTYASLPPCEEEQALRLFVADETHRSRSHAPDSEDAKV